MRTRPSDTAVEAARGLSDFLAGQAASETVWDELRAGGWLDVGTELADESSDEAQLVVDAAYLADAFAKHLIPVPFVEVLAGQIGRALADQREITVDGPVAVAFPHELFAGTSAAVDTFAPSLPTADLDIGVVNVRQLQVEATLRAMGAVSATRTAFAGVVDYSRSRRAYGQVIGSFQAMKHLMADMFVALELAESGCVWAANDLDNAFTVCDDVLARCLWVAGRCIQAYGGIGFTWEGGTHYYVRHIVAAQRLNRDMARVTAGGSN
ncbi:MAG TPA: acyl-CoA dehydrogenase family protein [Pseudonocardiaceae bacterium]|nr:acyl-CoA dehydrogenase family protein [Pseudonocardiaceae bacterium]